MKYIKNYVLFFTIISIIILVGSYLFASEILSIFGKEYMIYSDSFIILIIRIIGIFLLRGVYGNLLASIGRIEVNYYIICMALIINVIYCTQIFMLYVMYVVTWYILCVTYSVLFWFLLFCVCILWHKNVTCI